MNRWAGLATTPAVWLLLVALGGGLATMERGSRFGDTLLVVSGVAALATVVAFAILLDAYTHLALRFAEQRLEWAGILAHTDPTRTGAGEAVAEPAGTSAPSRPAEATPCVAHPARSVMAIELDPVDDEVEFGVWRVWYPEAWALPQGTPLLVTFPGQGPVEMVVVGWDDAGCPHVGKA